MSDRMRRPLAEADPEIAAAVDHEIRRQHEGLEMIASENFVSRAVLEAAGSVFTNKYAEGYPGSATTADASSPTSSRTWPATAPSSSLAPSTPTSSPTPAPRPTPPPTWRSSSPATPSSASTSPWRPPHPRPQAQLLRQALPRRLLRRDSKDTSPSTTTSSKQIAEREKPK